MPRVSANFIHTSDWHLGKPFAGIEDPDKQASVRRGRIEVLTRLGDLARDRGAEFVLVAGDLFDSIQPTNATVAQAFEVIGQMGVPVYAIPGNHDHAGPGGPWGQDFVKRQIADLAPNFKILLEPKPMERDSAVILPCPLLEKFTNTDPTQWLRKDWAGAEAADKPRIVLAHGSVWNFSGADLDDESEENRPANQIDLDRLPSDELDYVALGDWHGLKELGENCWYSGTPEPDRFPKGEEYQSGQSLVVNARRGESPEVEPVNTAQLQWLSQAFNFDAEQTPAVLKDLIDHRLEGLGQECLLDLELSGDLNLTGRAKLDQLVVNLDALLLRVKLNQVAVKTTPDKEELLAHTEAEGNPLIESVAGRLVGMLNQGGETEALALAALNQLHAARKDD